MGGSISEEEEDCRFFDAQEEIPVPSNSNSHYSFYADEIEIAESSFRYGVWMCSPGSVTERRNRFLEWMSVMESDCTVRENSVDVIGSISSRSSSNVLAEEVDRRVRETSGAVLRSSGFEDEFRSSRSSNSCWSTDSSDWSGELLMKEEEFMCKVGNLDGEMECSLDYTDENFLDKVEETPSSSGSSLSFQQLMEKDSAEADNSVATPSRRGKKGWLNRLRSFACVLDQQVVGSPTADLRLQKVKVRHSEKKLKELSAMFIGQDFQAHNGAILKMKFSPDGQFLASAGEDGIVRIWQVVEDERSNDVDIPEIDPSCIYFTVNHLSELTPLFVEKEKTGKLRKTSDSACIIFPPKVFRLLESPVHEFYGHDGEILDLSWSNNNYLLSSSADKTVRLWQVGCNHCLGVFKHSNYVTCVQFNPVDDKYFISGSIDGKVRIWAVGSRQVVDWTDIREIVTAVSYRPDGEGVLVGCMLGSCRFYHVTDNRLQLDREICLCSKKKSPCKRITGFEFFPHDPSKVMVTCADSQIRILHGTDVISRYRGGRSSANQYAASFTSDGKHIISTSEDSNVYIWNCSNWDGAETKAIKSSERFSSNASVAIPWCGMKNKNLGSSLLRSRRDSFTETLPASPSCFSLGPEFFLETFPKGSATWPEEQLPASSLLPSSPAMHKTHYKFLKSSCHSTSSSHAWGMVIVTAGWDGRIRSFLNYGLPTPL